MVGGILNFLRVATVIADRLFSNIPLEALMGSGPWWAQTLAVPLVGLMAEN